MKHRGGGERERERGRGTDRQTDRQRNPRTPTHLQRQTERETHAHPLIYIILCRSVCIHESIDQRLMPGKPRLTRNNATILCDRPKTYVRKGNPSSGHLFPFTCLIIVCAKGRRNNKKKKKRERKKYEGSTQE